MLPTNNFFAFNTASGTSLSDLTRPQKQSEDEALCFKTIVVTIEGVWIVGVYEAKMSG
jgi:hypothetical protein